MNELTTRQQQILSLIQRRVEETGLPPTRVEIAEEMGFRSPNAAEEHLRALARKGVIEMIKGAARGIRLVGHYAVQLAGEEGVMVPLVGRVAAGEPILAEQHVESRYQLDPDLFHPAPHYLLHVQGMSMRDVGIMDGDLVAVHRTPEVRNGQIVVARLEDEVTVKRYRQEGTLVWLLPENSEYAPIRVDLRTTPMTLEGIVVGVIRRGFERIPFNPSARANRH
jgi:repressor LexA